MIHAYASQPNYWRHLSPVVDELRARGLEVRCWAARAAQPWGARIPDPGFRNLGGLIVVASWVDARKAAPHPAVYLEHGAGQTYADGSPTGYAGAPKLDHVRLFLAPNEEVAGRWRGAYPQAAVQSVGSPALDQHHTNQAERPKYNYLSSEPPLVAITSHWPCGVCPETMPALPLYERAIGEVYKLETSFRLVGHAHPRGMRRTRAMWDRLGIPFEVDPDQVLRQADLLVADNTSLLYEAAAIGLPSLSLNAPSYRREVEHGLRFWSHVPGLQCDAPRDLQSSILDALADPPEAQDLRARAAARAYSHRDGRSSSRAADAIEKVL